jgi:hypothetical protein
MAVRNGASSSTMWIVGVATVTSREPTNHLASTSIREDRRSAHRVHRELVQPSSTHPGFAPAYAPRPRHRIAAQAIVDHRVSVGRRRNDVAPGKAVIAPARIEHGLRAAPSWPPAEASSGYIPVRSAASASAAINSARSMITFPLPPWVANQLRDADASDQFRLEWPEADTSDIQAK